LETLSNLQEALGDPNADGLMVLLSDRIQQWESAATIPISLHSLGHISTLPSTPSPVSQTQSEFSYGSEVIDITTRQMVSQRTHC
jgi:hypothetical protein